MSEVEEAQKALSLARKYDLEGNTSSAIKWTRKSLSINSTEEARSLLKRLEAQGSSGKGTASSGGADGTPASGMANGSAAEGLRQRSSASGAGADPKKERTYTSEQLAVVKRVRKAGGDFYAVLGVEKSVNENGIKKAYRKLALQLHPDKNGAPGADEAFKLVSKAFTILSDSDKRGAYDRFGGDPEQRFPSSGSSAAGRAGGSAFGPGGARFARGGPGMFAEEIDPNDLFNMFFGGGMGNGFGGGGTTFSFGGPGGATFYTNGGPRRARAGQRQQQQQQPQNANVLLQLLPLLLLGLFSLLSYAPSLFSTQDPSYSFAPSGPYRDQRYTPQHSVSYYVARDQFTRHPFVTGQSQSNGGLRGFEDRVERDWRNRLYGQCERHREYQSRRLQNTQGFFGIGADPEAAARIRSESYPSCEELKNFGIHM